MIETGIPTRKPVKTYPVVAPIIKITRKSKKAMKNETGVTG